MRRSHKSHFKTTPKWPAQVVRYADHTNHISIQRQSYLHRWYDMQITRITFQNNAKMTCTGGTICRSHKSHFKTTPKSPAQVVRYADHTNHISKQRQNDLHRWYDTQITRITFQNNAKMTCTGGTIRRSHESHFKTTPKWPAQVVRYADHTNHISKQRQNHLHRWYDMQITRITFQNNAKMTCTGGTIRRSHESHFKTTPKWPAQVVRHADHTNHLFKTPLKWPAQVVLHADHTNNISKQRQNDLHRWYDTQITRITFQNNAKMTCTGGTIRRSHESHFKTPPKWPAQVVRRSQRGSSVADRNHEQG